MKLPGVINVLTYKNSLNLHFPQGSDPGSGKYAEKDLLPLQSDRIFYNGQAIAVVIAETFEIAEQAASLVKVSYMPDEPAIDLKKNLGKAYAPKSGLGGQQSKAKTGRCRYCMKVRRNKIKCRPIPHRSIITMPWSHMLRLQYGMVMN